MRPPSLLVFLLVASALSLAEAQDGAAIAASTITIGIVALCVLTCCMRRLFKKRLGTRVRWLRRLATGVALWRART